MCAKYDPWLVLFIILPQIGTFLAAMACISSIPTVQYVPSCPSTEKDWFIAAERKLCSSVGQNCSTPDKFLYHCLVNSFLNATLEVCAPVWKMNGYCPEFNVPGKRIQPVLTRDCSKSSDKCPRQYNSSEVYNYPSCFKLQQFQFRTSKFTETIHDTSTVQDATTHANDTSSSDSKWKELFITAIVLVIVLVIVALVVIVGILYFLKWRKKGASKKGTESSRASNPDSELGTNTILLEKGTKPSSTSNSDRMKMIPEGAVTSKAAPSSGSTQRKEIYKYCKCAQSEKNQTAGDEEGFIVAAINLGTTHTKYGFCFVSCEKKTLYPEIHVQPSAILLNPDEEFLSFGEKAIEDFLELETPGNNNHHYFKTFSILNTISKSKNCKEKNFADQKGRDVKLSKIFIGTLKCLKMKISNEIDTKFRNMRIEHWILSVPLTWTKDAQEFLKYTAQQAGLTTNLHVVKEHQAVLSWLSNMEGQKKNEGGSLFVDLGGGSTKVYSVNAGKEWIASDNTPCVGGFSIWIAFQRYIESVFTRDVYEDFKVRAGKNNFKLYLEMCSAMFSNGKNTISQLQRSSHFETLKVLYDGIALSKNFETMEETLLEETLLKELKEDIKECIHYDLTKFPSSGTVYVFGGASRSDNLYKFVESLLGEIGNLNVQRINDPDRAIIGGSIIEGIRLKR